MALMRMSALVILAALVVAACESKDDDTIYKAQGCLDSATAATAQTCKDMVAGMTSKEAYIIDCSADFILQGFTSSAMASAFQQLKNSTNSTSPGAMLGFLVFNSTTSATTALSDCQLSGVDSFAVIASLANVSTQAAFALPGFDPSTYDRNNGLTSADLTSAINDLNSSSTGQTAAGNAVLTAYNSSCNQSANANSQLCQLVVQAVSNGNGNPQTIGQYFLSNVCSSGC